MNKLIFHSFSLYTERRRHEWEIWGWLGEWEMLLNLLSHCWRKTRADAGRNGGRPGGKIGSALSENVCVINDERRKSIIALDGGEVFAEKLSARVSEP